MNNPQVYVSGKRPMGGQCHSDLLDLEGIHRKERPGKLCYGVLLQYDNAPIHTSQVVAHTVCECEFRLLPRLPYFVEQAPNDYFLFSNPKNGFRSQRYVDDNGPFTRCVKLRVAHTPGMPRIFPRNRLQRRPLVSYPSIHYATWVTPCHVACRDR